MSEAIARYIRYIGTAVAWATVVPIAFFSGLQMLDRKLGLGVSASLPDWSTSLLFILIVMAAGFTYLRDGHVRVDILRRKWPARRLAWIEITGCLLIVIPLSMILIWYGWQGIERTTGFAETQVKVRRWAGFVGPILLMVSSGIVVHRNLEFLFGRRAAPSPEPEKGFAGDE